MGARSEASIIRPWQTLGRNTIEGNRDVVELAWKGRQDYSCRKAVRTIPYGFLGVLYAVYLKQLGFDLFLIGVVLTVTTASSALYTLVASFVADSLGRKRTLIFFALMDALAGALLISSSEWWALV